MKWTIRRAHAVQPVADLQIEYALISRSPERKIFPVLEELGIGVTAYGVLSRGLLSSSKPAGPGDIRSHLPRFSGGNSEQNSKTVAELARLAAEKGVTPAQLAIAWVLAKSERIVPVIGARTLSGQDIASAKAWVANRPKDAPVPTDLHMAFIKASEEAEDARIKAERNRLAEIAQAQQERAKALAERENALRQLSRRTTLGLTASGLLTTVAGGLAYWGTSAEQRFRREEAERKRLLAASEEERRRRGAQRTDIKGQIVAYASGPDQAAEDGINSSPYTSVLLSALKEPGAGLSSVLQFEARKVNELSSITHQRPYFSTDLDGELYLLDQPSSRKKTALVIAAANYEYAPKLANTIKDGQRWREFLERCAFEVTFLSNPTRSECAKAIASFSNGTTKHTDNLENPFIHRAGFSLIKPPPAPDNSLAFFFYSGHGFSINNVGRIALVDCAVDNEIGLENGSIDLPFYKRDTERNCVSVGNDSRYELPAAAATL